MRDLNVSMYLSLTYLTNQANVLIDDNGEACLADFGLTGWSETQARTTVTRARGASLAWLAPELWDEEMESDSEPPKTKASDIYAFGMTIYEVCRLDCFPTFFPEY
jgi:serine/threonine protein kinase